MGESGSSVDDAVTSSSPSLYRGTMTAKLTTEEFIRRSIETHGPEKYSYSESVYINNLTKVKIWCNTCEKFFYQLPQAHWKGFGCKSCGVLKRAKYFSHSIEDVIKRAQERCLPQYDYSRAVYKNTHTKVIVGCLHHGDFEIAPSDLLSGKGCPSCALISRTAKRSLGLDRFIERASSVHDNKYSYGSASYKNMYTDILITCPEHGEFLQQPVTHLRPSGCPLCAETGFDESKDGVLYVVNIEGVFNFTGFGITRDSDTRLSRHAKAVKDSGCFISEKYISKVIKGSVVKQLETLLKQTFPLAACSKDIPGFKTESTTTPYQTVVAFVEEHIKDYIAKNK